MKNDFFVKENIPILLCIAADVIHLGALVMYCVTGKTEFTAELSSFVIAFGSVTVLLGICSILLKLFSWGKKWVEVGLCVAALFGLLTFLFYIVNEVNYIANILVSIDGTKISVTFALTVLLYLISWIMMLVAAITCKYKPKENCYETGK